MQRGRAEKTFATLMQNPPEAHLLGGTLLSGLRVGLASPKRLFSASVCVALAASLAAGSRRHGVYVLIACPCKSAMLKNPLCNFTLCTQSPGTCLEAGLSTSDSRPSLNM